jgi:riboflavin kinase
VTTLTGVVTSGVGQATQFMAIPWVRDGIRQLLGFEPYPGTLNVQLLDPDVIHAWRRIRNGPALPLIPPPPDRCGARLFPVVVAPDVVAAVIVPDVTRHGSATLELIAPLHVRTHLGLRDQDRVTLRIAP